MSQLRFASIVRWPAVHCGGGMKVVVRTGGMKVSEGWTVVDEATDVDMAN